jgi:hypothetical protein
MSGDFGVGGRTKEEDCNVIFNTDVDFDLERNRTNTLHKYIKIHYTNNLNKSIEKKELFQ